MTPYDRLLTQLTAGLARGPAQREFRCHPDVFLAIKNAEMASQDDPFLLRPGASPAYGVADIVVDPDLGPGCWQWIEDGQIILDGRLEPASDEDKIRDAMTEATDHPRRIATR